MFEKIKNTCRELVQGFESIPSDRKVLLEKIGSYIQGKKDVGEVIQLMYVCTHNSRRSHYGQIWAAVAAEFYGVASVKSFSGGTEATAFNPNAIAALRELGFEIETKDHTENPIYVVRFNEEGENVTCFSKVYDHASNPKENFAAIMTCGDAEQNCPFIPGVDLRVGTTYEDPKAFDGTPLQAEKYKERALQIGLEVLYTFSKIK